MEALDGNAIAGPLFEHFGGEMTAVVGSCAHCGRASHVAELVVYTRCPGTVARCPHCGNIVMVLVTIRDSLQIDSTAFRMAKA
jgi:uncharacterized Zn finger protein